jgi:hypothetical protein
MRFKNRVPHDCGAGGEDRKNTKTKDSKTKTDQTLNKFMRFLSLLET